jgi:hypothetical protein
MPLRGAPLATLEDALVRVRGWALVGLALMGSAHLSATAPAVQASDCVSFASQGRLQAGTPFSYPLPSGLELKLTTDWDITVVSSDQPDVDYLWVGSPPLRTAPQRRIGPAYGMSARESVGFGRDLRFVITSEDYRAAREAIDSNRPTGEILRRLEELGKGRLSLVISEYGLRGDRLQDGTFSETLEWISFRGEACVP